MDPLSVSASVVGLLTITLQVSHVLREVVSKSTHAPKSLNDLSLEVDTVRLALIQLQAYILRKLNASPSRTGFVLVEQVIVTLSSCVLTFSELESLVQGFDSDVKMGLMDRFRWLSKADAIADLLSRIQNHKTSLILMLQILESQSQLEVEQAFDRLTDLVEQSLLSYRLLEQRLLGQNFNSQITLLTRRDFKETALFADYEPSYSQSAISAIGPSLEECLNTSPVYRRGQLKSSPDAISLKSSDRESTSWSISSELTLKDISHISFIELPIFAQDITNASKYVFDDKEPDSGMIGTGLKRTVRSQTIINRVATLYGLARSNQDITKFEHFKYTLLHVACLNGRQNVVRKLLKRGEDVNARAIDDEALYGTTDEAAICITPILLASWIGDREILDLLIKQPGVDLNVKTCRGISLIHYAAYLGEVEIFKTLLDCGLDPLERSIDGSTAWHHAAHHGCLPILEMIFNFMENRNNFYVDMADAKGNTALLYAATGDYIHVCDYLLKLGANLETSNHMGETPVYISARAYSLKLFERLLAYGANIVQRTRHGNSILHAAAKSRRVTQLQQCLDRRLDPNAQNIMGETPLHFAVMSKHEETCATLLKNRADPNVRDHTGLTALDLVSGDSSLWKLFEPYIRERGPSAMEMRRATFRNVLGAISDHQIMKQIIPSDLWFMGCFLLNHGGPDHEIKVCLAAQLERLRIRGSIAEHPCCYCSSSISRGAWNICRRYPKHVLCHDCYAKRIKDSSAVSRYPSSGTYLEFGGDEWYSLPLGTVNPKGQTIDEWLKEYRAI